MSQTFFVIYKITNVKNNKIYIGMHRTKDVNDDYLGSGSKLNRSIRYYGREFFKKEILFVFNDEKDMINKEIELVNESFIKRKDTYNVILGGTGKWSLNSISEIQREKGRKANIKMKWLRENDPEWVKSKAIKTSNSLKLAYKEGRHLVKMPIGIGDHHTQETKDKISKILKGHKHQQGSKNSQYETRLITNGIKTTRIKKNEFIPLGWRLGATYKNRAPKKFKSMWINNGTKTKMIKKDISIPIGWKLGRKTNG